MTVPANWKDENRTIQILTKAEKGRYGVIAAIAYNLEQIHGLVTAAEEARSPLIIQFFPWAVTYADGLLVRTAKEAVSRVSVPISIHLDHAQDEKIIQYAADNLPFDSIMVDMSHYEKAENLEKTAKWVKYCHERKIATEAEPGRIEGAEDGVMDTAGLEASKTTAEEVDEFIATGVDSLAPAFGNVHGEYGKLGPQLDFERYVMSGRGAGYDFWISPPRNKDTDNEVCRFEKIRAQIAGRVRVALHGTNGFPPDLMKQCIAAGATKINVNRLVLDDYYTHLRSQVTRLPHTTLIEEGTSNVIRQTKEWMEICGSAGQA
ncbi:tagatose 1,6-diphosphate aldolase [Colletotrichum abscissum]|uniref:Fructose-bisphosphate aldolase n=1 Tax=Colletotrichum costaricense TaxID=1209916 RepID=A0AAI9YJ02_9PEZI|nr:tagatose 1,6-diphosphate aldolase [Colletotrichum costaricense]XP_060391914.1 tagatose 1,6-diphosphate aldolase [Colletotrichum abscissum]KAK1476548.1 tagatose 1,6-diphosphate aldolase [Colletotrichum abscissum]KAK1512397.1 tagatose 1,6-diphosphate aldolase [Colletotrichum costaricense]